MVNFYILFIFIGSFFLFLSILKIQKQKNINKYMLLLDESLINIKKRKKIGFLTIFKVKVLNYFSPLYLKEEGFKGKSILIMFVFTLIIVLINEFFLKFSIFVFIIIGILWGTYLAKILQVKALKNEFEENFPQALVILNGAISSGSNITQALEDCSQSLEGSIAKEFKTMVKSLDLGEEPSRVFANSYKRLPFKNYYFFLMSLLVSIKSGAKLKEILSRLSSATTKAKAMEKKKEAMTSEARMSSKITAAIPFIFLFVMKFISPENFDFILYDEKGRYILYYFLASEFIGMMIILFLMRKL